MIRIIKADGSAEVKLIETLRSRAAETVAAAKRVHPYEEPVINVIPLLGIGL